MSSMMLNAGNKKSGIPEFSFKIVSHWLLKSHHIWRVHVVSQAKSRSIKKYIWCMILIMAYSSPWIFSPCEREYSWPLRHWYSHPLSQPSPTLSTITRAVSTITHPLNPHPLSQPSPTLSTFTCRLNHHPPSQPSPAVSTVNYDPRGWFIKRPAPWLAAELTCPPPPPQLVTGSWSSTWNLNKNS